MKQMVKQILLFAICSSFATVSMVGGISMNSSVKLQYQACPPGKVLPTESHTVSVLNHCIVEQIR